MPDTDYRIAFDTGGTFTDFALQNAATGAFAFGKVPSTNADPALAVLTGMAALLDAQGLQHAQLSDLFHATTVATNAILERRGARCALVTTAGFRDVVLIGRQKRYETYDLYLDKPAPLVQRKDIFEVDERIDHHGRVLVPLSDKAIEALVAQLRGGAYEAVAISLLHAYANPDHETRLAAAVRESLPDLHVSASADVSPKYREYERTSTVLADSYIKPVVDNYVTNMSDALARQGVKNDFMIMQSNGGLVSPGLSRQYPVRIVESGPAAGVSMCAVVGTQIGHKNLLTFDMGGTTAKLGAIDDGRPAIASTFEVGQVRYRPGSGLPLNISAIELLEIGAGGGSIASVDMGVIKVGPRSAGAEPGPICYGNGGTELTITDANLVLGYLNPEFFNGGAMVLDTRGAREGVSNIVAKPLGLSVEEAAWGVHTVANANMERAMRVVSIEKGRDPRRYAIVGFGGAGPLHVCRLARALGVPKVIIPYGAGLGSALGLLAADSRVDATVTHVMALHTSATEEIAAIYDGLRQRLVDELSSLDVKGTIKWRRTAYIRYEGQGYEIRIDLPDDDVDADFVRVASERFHDAYEQNYGYRQPDTMLEVTDWCLAATIPNQSEAIQSIKFEGEPRCPEGMVRQAYFPEFEAFVDCPVFDRGRLKLAGTVIGPAIIEDEECTIVVPPKDHACLSERGDVIIAVAVEDL